MADKVATFPKSKLGIRIGRLDDADIRRLNHAVIVFLGLATTPRVRSASEAEPPVTKPPASPEDRA
jgi:mRNA interferase MazF